MNTRLSNWTGDGLLVPMYLTLFAGAWWCVQAFMLAALGSGAALAIGMHMWRYRQATPSTVLISSRHAEPTFTVA